MYQKLQENWMIGIGLLCSVATSAQGRPIQINETLNELHYSSVHVDSGIDGPAYDVIQAELRDLAKLYPEWASYHVYGQSVKGRDLGMLKVESPVPACGTRSAVMMSGATHGNEYLGVEHRLPRWVLENKNTVNGLKLWFQNQGVIYFIPVINPDGYAGDQRENSHGTDLNRDFDIPPINEKRFTEVETRFLTDMIATEIKNENLSLKLSIDYHCCANALLTPWSYTTTPMAAKDVKRHGVYGDLVKSIFGKDYQIGSTYDVLRYLAKGTSKDYYFGVYDTLGYTYEGEYKVEKDKFEKHTAFWDATLASLFADVPKATCD